MKQYGLFHSKKKKKNQNLNLRKRIIIIINALSEVWESLS